MRAYNHEPKLDRKTYLGGSDIGAVMGIDPYRSPLSVYNDKLGIQVEEEPKSYAMRKGNHFEGPIFSLYAETRGVWLGAAGVTQPHPIFPFLRGNYDRTLLSGKNGTPTELLEGKTANIRQSHKWSTPGDETVTVPTHYYAQANYYCGLLGMVRFRIVADLAWFPDDLAEYEFDFHQDFFDLCCEEGARFWVDHVKAQVPPPLEMGKSTIDDIVRLYPQGNQELVDAPEDIAELYDLAKSRYREMKEAETFLKEFKAQVQFACGPASGMQFGSEVVKVVDKRGSPKYQEIAAFFAEMAGVKVGTDQWNEAVAKFTGKSTRYVRLAFSGGD